MHSCPTTTGNLSSLESLTQLKDVILLDCKQIEGNINRSHESIQHNGLGHYSAVASRQQLNVPGKLSMLKPTHPCCTTTGNLKSLESLTQLKEVNFTFCDKIEGNFNRSYESIHHNILGHL